MTLEEHDQLQALERQMQNTMAAFSIGNLILNLFLGVGLRYLWKMVNLLQFIVFMRLWLVKIPAEADMFLKSLRALALFEFLPTDELDSTLMDWFGIEHEDEDN